jgi:FkbM family methyltransferase
VHGEFECLRHLLPYAYPGTILDAGGYIGTAALALSDLYPQASVITIEPSSQNFSILESNVAGTPNARPVRAALMAGDRISVSLSDRGKGHWGYSVIPGTGLLVGGDASEEVPAIGLDRLGVEVDEIGILKRDIEGAGLELFTQQADLLRRIPVIIVELHDRIVQGCGRAFFALSRDRLVIKTGGEKYLSVRR